MLKNVPVRAAHHDLLRHVARPTRRYASTSTTPVASSPTKPKIIFSGIQPTGVPHLGNYLGALQQWKKLQDEAADDTRLIYSIVDLHAITVPQRAEDLRRCKREMLATLLAIGLDPEKSTIFMQSSVPEHSELMWILSCQASMGYLSRMTQWKSKLDLPDSANPLAKSITQKLKLGLFSYPVLQAADILVHRATHVPVGHDQSQHLEFAREIALGFNHLHGDVLVAPETLLSPAKRVMALDQPAQKMSKSHPSPKSRILLTDTREDIAGKIRTAVTDPQNSVSYDPTGRPGVSNLLDIVFHLNPSGAQSPEQRTEEFAGLSLKAFKDVVVDTIDNDLAPIRDRLRTIIGGSGKEIDDAAEIGARKASETARGTMKTVRDAMGL